MHCVSIIALTSLCAGCLILFFIHQNPTGTNSSKGLILSGTKDDSFVLAENLYKEGNYVQALETLKLAKTTHKCSRECTLLYGIVNLKMGNYIESLQNCQEVLESEKCNFAALSCIGETYELLGETVLSTSYYRSAVVDCNSTDLSTLLRYTNILLESGEGEGEGGEDEVEECKLNIIDNESRSNNKYKMILDILSPYVTESIHIISYKKSSHARSIDMYIRILLNYVRASVNSVSTNRKICKSECNSVRNSSKHCDDYNKNNEKENYDNNNKSNNDDKNNNNNFSNNNSNINDNYNQSNDNYNFKIQESISILETIAFHFPTNIDSLKLLHSLLIRSRNYLKSLEISKKIVINYPTSCFGHYLMGRSLLELNRSKESISALNVSIMLHKKKEFKSTEIGIKSELKEKFISIFGKVQSNKNEKIEIQNPEFFLLRSKFLLAMAHFSLLEYVRSVPLLISVIEIIESGTVEEDKSFLPGTFLSGSSGTFFEVDNYYLEKNAYCALGSSYYFTEDYFGAYVPLLRCTALIKKFLMGNNLMDFDDDGNTEDLRELSSGRERAEKMEIMNENREEKGDIVYSNTKINIALRQEVKKRNEGNRNKVDEETNTKINEKYFVFASEKWNQLSQVQHFLEFEEESVNSKLIAIKISKKMKIKSSKTFHDNVNNEKYEENKNIKNKAYLGEEKVSANENMNLVNDVKKWEEKMKMKEREDEKEEEKKMKKEKTKEKEEEEEKMKMKERKEEEKKMKKEKTKEKEEEEEKVKVRGRDEEKEEEKMEKEKTKEKEEEEEKVKVKEGMRKVEDSTALFEDDAQITLLADKVTATRTTSTSTSTGLITEEENVEVALKSTSAAVTMTMEIESITQTKTAKEGTRNNIDDSLIMNDDRRKNHNENGKKNGDIDRNGIEIENRNENKTKISTTDLMAKEVSDVIDLSTASKAIKNQEHSIEVAEHSDDLSNTTHELKDSLPQKLPQISNEINIMNKQGEGNKVPVEGEKEKEEEEKEKEKEETDNDKEKEEMESESNLQIGSVETKAERDLEKDKEETYNNEGNRMVENKDKNMSKMEIETEIGTKIEIETEIGTKIEIETEIGTKIGTKIEIEDGSAVNRSVSISPSSDSDSDSVSVVTFDPFSIDDVITCDTTKNDKTSGNTTSGVTSTGVITSDDKTSGNTISGVTSTDVITSDDIATNIDDDSSDGANTKNLSTTITADAITSNLSTLLPIPPVPTPSPLLVPLLPPHLPSSSSSPPPLSPSPPPPPPVPSPAAIRVASQYMKMAAAYVTRGDYELALKQLSKAEKKAEFFPDIFMMRGQVYEALGQYAKAADDYLKIGLYLDPGNGTVLSIAKEIGKHLLQTGNYADAANVLSPLHNLNRTDEPLAYLLSVCLTSTGRYEEALIALSHSDTSIILGEGSASIEVETKNVLNTSVGDVSSYSNSSSNDGSRRDLSSNNSSNSNSSSGSSNNVTERANTTTSSVPLTPERVRLLAGLYERTGRSVLAEGLWVKAVSNGLSTWSELGEMYVRQSKYEEAAKSFEKELQLLTGNVPGEAKELENIPLVGVDVNSPLPHSLPHTSSVANDDISKIDNNNNSIIDKDNERENGNENKNEVKTSKVVKEEVKVRDKNSFSPVEKIKIKSLHARLAQIYSTQLSNLRMANFHYETVLELGGDMTKEIRIFYAKYANELNQYVSTDKKIKNIENENGKIDNDVITVSNIKDENIAHVKKHNGTESESSSEYKNQNNTNTTQPVPPSSTSFSTSSKSPKPLERAPRWVVRSERESVPTNELDSERDDNMKQRGGMKMGGMRGNDGVIENTLATGTGTAGLRGSAVEEGESAFEAQIRENEEFEDDDEYSDGEGGGGGGGQQQSSLLNAISNSRKGRG